LLKWTFTDMLVTHLFVFCIIIYSFYLLANALLKPFISGRANPSPLLQYLGIRKERVGVNITVTTYLE